jgi:hypothetical protein
MLYTPFQERLLSQYAAICNMPGIFAGSYFVAGSAVLILVLTAALASLITRRYASSRQPQYAFWGVGLWLFAFGVLLEALFAIGVYDTAMAVAYFLSVALLVEFLAMGSVSMTKSKKAKYAYAAYSALAGVAVLYSLISSHLGNVVVNHVVFGVLPISVVASSSAATFPAAVILIALAARSYIKRKSSKMLSIIAGVVVVSIAGTLYIAEFPAFLYYSEFIGILLLWLGFI